tara:strand:+ start:639 stop:908 length:270 start_codon:yes stop_codon:yes gene_type:complete
MHIRLTCDITQEQIDCGYDLTLLTLHSRFVDWLMTLDLPIVNFSIGWHTMEDNQPHMIITADLLKDSEVKIDEEFFDELHLGGKDEDDV